VQRTARPTLTRMFTLVPSEITARRVAQRNWALAHVEPGRNIVFTG